MTYQVQSLFEENFKILSNLNPTTIVLTETYEDIPDSHIDYIPSIDSSYVIYQLSLYYGRQGSTATELNCFFKLQYSNDNGLTWLDWGDNTECFIGSSGTFLRQRGTVDLKWSLNTTGWSNVKRLRVLSKEDAGSSVKLHELEDFYNTTGKLPGTHKYGCSVSCYSVE